MSINETVQGDTQRDRTCSARLSGGRKCSRMCRHKTEKDDDQREVKTRRSANLHPEMWLREAM